MLVRGYSMSPEFIAERVAMLAYEEIQKRVLQKLKAKEHLEVGEQFSIHICMDVGGDVRRTEDGWEPTEAS